jgi:hypothetical protein
MNFDDPAARGPFRIPSQNILPWPPSNQPFVVQQKNFFYGCEELV